MRACLLFICWICAAAGFAQVSDEKAVTYTFSGGRFGDNLLVYMRAKWISYKYGIPLLYKKFLYSDQLVLHDIEPRCPWRSQPRFQATLHLMHETDIDPGASNSILYVLDYYPEFYSLRSLHAWPTIDVDWEDEGFRNALREMIRPKRELEQVPLPDDRLTVAVHVRKGGGVDRPDAMMKNPLHFPPDQFYIDQIRDIYHRYGRPLYVHLVTDDLNPGAIAQEYKQALNGLDIQIGYRLRGNAPHAYVLEDFFAMTAFDCLIRPESNFSFAAARLANYVLEVAPAHASFENKKPVIDQVDRKE
jgi:hypothetical protein